MMVTKPENDVYYDPYDRAIYEDPYPTLKRLRDEQPLYHNERYEFFAVSRFEDVERGLQDRSSFLSFRGDILEMITQGVDIPTGTLIFEDPPNHTIHRHLLSRVFTPRAMNALEGEVRAFCARRLDPLVGEASFDLITELGSQVPMRVIGMLLGVPEGDQEAIRDAVDTEGRAEPGQPSNYKERGLGDFSGFFADYIDFRYKHPTDDVMTKLIMTEFEDETGTTRTLTRAEALAYLNILAGAGNETTNRLIGWTGKILGEHPDARRELVEDRSLLTNAIEEILRLEPSSQYIGRSTARDMEIYGRTVPEGSAFLCLVGSANHDERVFPQPDIFDIRRKIGHHLTFGYGPHFCLGAALARLEGRVALDELLQRFPNWEVDLEQSRLGSTTGVRGWDALRLVVV